jgi:LPS export ABC transporter protein LptC
MTARQKHHGSRRLKAALILVIIILAGIVAAVFTNYRYGVQQAGEPDRPGETDATFSITRFEHTAMKNGKKEWTIKADTARLFSGTQKALLTNVETVFFMEGGEPVKMQADYGEVDLASKNIRAWENVVVTHPQYTLTTETLNYTYDTRIMVIDAPLEITGEKILFTADSARYEMDRNTVTFEGNIESWFDETLFL